MDEIIWKYGKTELVFEPDLCGGGDAQAQWWVDYISRRFPKKRFPRLFEWCAGPGFIGFALMEAGLCDHLVLADINERAIESVRKTVARNPHLYNRVTAYVSDNLKAIPPSERFDLVVANPPFFQVPREVSFSRVVLTTGTPIEGNSLIGSDPEWKIHRDFFKGIPRFLGPDSIVLIAEFEPFEQEPRVFPAAKAAIDTRARPPVADFYPMIRESGLRLREVVWAGPRDPAKPNTRIIGAKDPEVLRELNSGDHFWLLVVTPSRMTPLE